MCQKYEYTAQHGPQPQNSKSLHRWNRWPESVWVCGYMWYYDIVYLSIIIVCLLHYCTQYYRAVIARAEPQWICGVEKKETRGVKKRIQNGATNTIFQFRSYRTDRVDRRRRTSGPGRVTHDIHHRRQSWAYCGGNIILIHGYVFIASPQWSAIVPACWHWSAR